MFGVTGPGPLPPIFPIGTELPCLPESRNGWGSRSRRASHHARHAVSTSVPRARRFCLRRGLRSAVSVPMTVERKGIIRNPARRKPRVEVRMDPTRPRCSWGYRRASGARDRKSATALRESRPSSRASEGASISRGGGTARRPRSATSSENPRRSSASSRACARYAKTFRPCSSSGETGTGKELACAPSTGSPAARQAPREGRTCAAIPESLIESELFGHERGPSPARHAAVGRFELADRRHALPRRRRRRCRSSLQAKLLRAICRTASSERDRRDPDSSRWTYGLIAATNRDLGRAVAEERFRVDLFYR